MQNKAAFEIHPLEESHLIAIADLDHSYHTDYVWQTEFNTEKDQVGVTFREVRLPRSMHVEYPRSSEERVGFGTENSGGFSAFLNGDIAGYIYVHIDKAPGAAWLSEVVVMRRLRRQGIGSALVLQAQKWGREQGCRRIVMEMQTKNYPAICMATKLGYEFSGFSDNYYSNQDIALFFNRRL